MENKLRLVQIFVRLIQDTVAHHHHQFYCHQIYSQKSGIGQATKNGLITPLITGLFYSPIQHLQYHTHKFLVYDTPSSVDTPHHQQHLVLFHFYKIFLTNKSWYFGRFSFVKTFRKRPIWQCVLSSVVHFDPTFCVDDDSQVHLVTLSMLPKSFHRASMYHVTS